MDVRRHVTAGRLSELFGADQVPTDTFLRTMGWRRVAEQELPLLAPETRRRYLEAYADGVNAYIDARPAVRRPSGGLEYSVLGLANGDYTVEPWTPVDSLAWLKAMAWDLRGNMEEEIDRAVLLAHGLDPRSRWRSSTPPTPTTGNRPIVRRRRGGRRGRSTPAAPPGGRPQRRATDDRPSRHRLAVYAAPTAVRAVGRARHAARSCSGNGERRASAPTPGSSTAALPRPASRLLANDPHLGPSMPGIWYQMGLHCELPARRGRLHLRRACRASSSATTSGSPGASPTSARTSPTSTSRRSTATVYFDGDRVELLLTSARRSSRSPAATRARSPSAPPSTARCSPTGRGPARRMAARPAWTRPAHRCRRCRRAPHAQPRPGRGGRAGARPHGALRRRAAVDRAAIPGAPPTRSSPSTRPTAGRTFRTAARAVRGAGAEPRLRRRRRPHRLPGAGPDPASGARRRHAGRRRAGTPRTTGQGYIPFARAAHRAQPGRRASS